MRSSPRPLAHRFKLKQEQENRRNASMLYDSSRDKLRRAEEQQQAEVEERQKVELALRSLELERRTLLNNMKQVRPHHLPPASPPTVRSTKHICLHV